MVLCFQPNRGYRMGKSVLGVGVIGAGGIVRRHAVAYRCRRESAGRWALPILDESRATAAKREHGFKEPSTDYRDNRGNFLGSRPPVWRRWGDSHQDPQPPPAGRTQAGTDTL